VFYSGVKSINCISLLKSVSHRGSANPSLLENLEIIHQQAIRICTGAYRSSPRESILIEAAETSLLQRRTILGLKYYQKILSLPSHIAKEALTNSSYHERQQRRPRIPKPLSYRISQDIQKTLPPLPPILKFPNKSNFVDLSLNSS